MYKADQNSKIIVRCYYWLST